MKISKTCQTYKARALLLLMLFWNLSAAGSSIDSLTSALNTSMQGSARINIILELGLALKDSSIDQAIERIEQAEIESQELGDPILEARVAWELGVLLLDVGLDSLAFQKLDRAKGIYLDNNKPLKALSVSIAKAKAYEELGNFRSTAYELENIYKIADSLATAKTAGYVHNFLGLTLWKLGRLADAEHHLKISIKHFNKANLPKRLARVYNNLGVIYFNWNRYEDALTNYHHASAIHDSLGNNPKKLILMSNIGATYLKLGAKDQARQTLLLAKEIAESDQYEKGIINASHWLARVEYESGNFKLATSYNEIALKHYQENKQYSGQIKILIELGRIYNAKLDYHNGELILREAATLAKKVGDLLEEARSERMLGYNLLLQGKYSEAETSLFRALELGRNEDYREVEMHALTDLGTLRLLTNQVSSGQIFKRKSESLRDSLFNADLRRKISELQVHYDLKERNNQIIRLNETTNLQKIKLERDRTRQIALISGMVVLIILVVALITAYQFQKRSRATIERQRNDLMELNAKLQAANSDQNQLFRIISHDLKGPLGTMKELLNLMAQGNVSPSKSQEVINTASESAGNLYRLIENLFDWALMQKGQLNIHPEYLDLTILVNRTSELFQRNFEQKQLKLTLQFHHESKVFADNNMTATILRNLLSNAMKFTESGGSISIRTTERVDDGLIEIEVEDTGIGIPAEAIPQIFDSTKSLRRRGTNNESTSGLGLTLVKEFVELQQGSIRIESEEGVGSTFNFTLPVGPPNQGQQA